MGDAAGKHGLLSVFFIEMHWVVIGGQLGEHFNLAITNSFGDRPGHADFQILDWDRTNRVVVAWLIKHFDLAF